MANEFLDELKLERSEVVAKSAITRESGQAVGSSYEKELGFDPAAFLRERLKERGEASWLDLCCGAAQALIDTAKGLRVEGMLGKVSLVGVDLIPMFHLVPADIKFLRLEAASLSMWYANQSFDLITSVHGLHYIGDKLGVIQRVTRWVNPGGRFLAHLDYDNVCLKNGSARQQIGKDLADAGFEYDSNRHMLMCQGPQQFSLAYRYLGADDQAGPNYTGQPAVNSYYESI